MADDHYNFILFVSGMSVKSGRAIENIQKICKDHLENKFKLQIIDISKDQKAAATYHIFAIPTLLKLSPAPVRMVLGDLSETEKVLKILEIK